MQIDKCITVNVLFHKSDYSVLKDRHTNATTRHAPPVIDKSQDWVLLHGEENEFGTILKFSRKLETCDNDDLTIDVSKYGITLETT